DQGDRSLQMIFRDHGLSDLVGFHYQRNDPAWAADDLLAKVKEIGRVVRGHNADRPALVPIILDGENCWEYYPDGGVAFLRKLYQQAASDPQVNPVRVGEHLAKYPAAHKIGRLFAGSWINHDFYIWIGHQEDRDGWDLLHQTREFLLRAEASERYEADLLEAARKELYIAEGSDWFWWYGDDHNSGQDDLFDELFRRHLRNVYSLLNEIPPSSLLRPITRAERRHIHSQPQSFLSVNVDGRYSFFEWQNAGVYRAGSERGTMTMVSDSVVREIHFGYDLERLMVRCDTLDRADKDLAECDELRLRFAEPFGLEVRVDLTDLKQPTAKVTGEGKPKKKNGVQVAVGKIFELTVPWSSLGGEVGQVLQFAVELFMKGESIGRSPSEGTIDVVVPGADFEHRVWQA
ncbi:MAG: hypothetical protein KDA58_16855, partial [Planctomycetaceae bacterium]|nr:hypothetical protein [Planctomycetaceae bacterium]